MRKLCWLAVFLTLALTTALRADDAKKVESAATFVKTDEKTSGNWKGVYGADGFNVATDAEKLPSYATLTPSAERQDCVWAATTDDERCLKKSADEAKDRLAACWYGAVAFDVDINLTDGNEHQVAVYCLDWESETRVMNIDVQDADTGAKLDTQTIKQYHGGKYLVWNLKGHIKFHFTNVGTESSNAVLSGFFFDPIPKK